MKNQAFLSLKDKSKKIKCRLLQFLFGALRVKVIQKQPIHKDYCKEMLSAAIFVWRFKG